VQTGRLFRKRSPPENWRELEAEALVGLTYEILKREAPGFS